MQWVSGDLDKLSSVLRPLWICFPFGVASTLDKGQLDHSSLNKFSATSPNLVFLFVFFLSREDSISQKQGQKAVLQLCPDIYFTICSRFNSWVAGAMGESFLLNSGSKSQLRNRPWDLHRLQAGALPLPPIYTEWLYLEVLVSEDFHVDWPLFNMQCDQICKSASFPHI